jgi:hypothetical protein
MFSVIEGRRRFYIIVCTGKVAPEIGLIQRKISAIATLTSGYVEE